MIKIFLVRFTTINYKLCSCVFSSELLALDFQNYVQFGYMYISMVGAPLFKDVCIEMDIIIMSGNVETLRVRSNG